MPGGSVPGGSVPGGSGPGAGSPGSGGACSCPVFATRSLSSHVFKSANCCFFLKQQGTHRPLGCTLGFRNPG
ncbi:MAG: hypothetical protein EBU84_00900 [Actinobacteria bacterium]|nr:hypothetical protein [Actinomycetota bacterium]